eukprot:TRINITY_DN73717_c0_g1_i1.p1 TRINITY_DN73717_c0_g1~~TRINITY_DN73717_c0_g1_i1.p1  ORF type:complete len:336 (-),score=30.94 TRINITY_DN73717_c0_g1_i1:259-1266(-)
MAVVASECCPASLHGPQDTEDILRGAEESNSACLDDVQVQYYDMIHCGRRVQYGFAGDPRGSPVILFYPAGGSRCMLASMHSAAKASSIRLICTNRPGKGSTDPAPEAGPKAHASTVCDDVIAVLDQLDIQKVSLLFLCAGTPFALLFAARHQARMTGKLVGIASWVSPADFTNAKSLYRLGAALPSWFVSSLVGSSFASAPTVMRCLPEAMAVRIVHGKLSALEQAAFSARFPDTGEALQAIMCGALEKGGVVEDMAVLLTGFASLGAEYSQVVGRVTLLHGEADEMSPVQGVEWLSTQLPGTVDLVKLPQGTHEGLLLLLHTKIHDVLCAISA